MMAVMHVWTFANPVRSVTIYGNDTNDLICSSDLKILAGLKKCYNSSWQYYSVDSCTPLSPSSSSTTLLPSSAISQVPSPTATLSPLSTASSSSNNVNIPAIVGGSVGGVLAIVAMIAVLLYYFCWLPKTKKQEPTSVQDTRCSQVSSFDITQQSLYTIEPPWSPQPRCELNSNNIVEAPCQTIRPQELAG